MKLDPGKGPLFLQIAGEIRRWIARGDLRPGDRLPPVRDLAKIFHVNPNTVVHALEELERSRVTCVRRGLGTYVREDLSPEELRRGLLLRAAAEFLREAEALGYGPAEASAALREVGNARASARRDEKVRPG